MAASRATHILRSARHRARLPRAYQRAQFVAPWRHDRNARSRGIARRRFIIGAASAWHLDAASCARVSKINHTLSIGSSRARRRENISKQHGIMASRRHQQASAATSFSSVSSHGSSNGGVISKTASWRRQARFILLFKTAKQAWRLRRHQRAAYGNMDVLRHHRTCDQHVTTVKCA